MVGKPILGCVGIRYSEYVAGMLYQSILKSASSPVEWDASFARIGFRQASHQNSCTDFPDRRTSRRSRLAQRPAHPAKPRQSESIRLWLESPGHPPPSESLCLLKDANENRD